MLILFLDQDEPVVAKAKRLSDHTIQITGCEVNLSGFHLMDDSGFVFGKHEGYTTLFKEDDNGFILSDDGSVYAEPEPIPEPEPYEPTEEELEEALRQNKQQKIESSKRILADYLEANPLISSCHNKKAGTYSVTEEKQTLMSNQYLSYTIEKQVTGDAKLTWNETGKACEEWTEEEFVELLLEVKAYVYPLVANQQVYEEQILRCSSQEELDGIEIIYGGA